MHQINVEQSALESFEHRAQEIRDQLNDREVFGLNVMGAIGSGKTSFLTTLLQTQFPETSSAVISGDVAGDEDSRRYQEQDIPAVNVSTGKECHVRPDQVQTALGDLSLSDLDFLFVENVGNLVCPADIPLGMHERCVLISITEGDDMVRKHPDIFIKTDLVILNKIDLASTMDADPDRIKNDFVELNRQGTLIETSTTTREGLPNVYKHLTDLSKQQ